jgi:hypothetical protein
LGPSSEEVREMEPLGIEERTESSDERERWNLSSQRQKRCSKRWNIEHGREVF